MKTYALPFAGLALLLSACAPWQGPQESLGSPGSYMKTVTVEPPPDICAADAYIDGYRAAYMRAWNQEIANKMALYRMAATQNPPDAHAKAAYGFYSSKLFDLKSANQKETRYDFVPPSIECEFHSHTLGKSRGNKEAVRDIDALKPPEAK